jgi:hypothetical protein
LNVINTIQSSSPGYRPSDGILGEMRVRELTEHHFVSIMLELLRTKGKRGVALEGIEGMKWKGKMKGKEGGEGRREYSY